MLTLAKSRKIIDGAVQRAEQLNAKISVAVCGRDGGLIAFSPAISCPIGAPMGREYFHMPMSFLLGDYVGVFPSWKKVLLKELAA